MRRWPSRWTATATSYPAWRTRQPPRWRLLSLKEEGTGQMGAGKSTNRRSKRSGRGELAVALRCQRPTPKMASNTEYA